MYNYVSDFTKFMNEYLEKNPEVAAQRLENRGTLWDVALNPQQQADFEAAELPKKPYAYQAD